MVTAFDVTWSKLNSYTVLLWENLNLTVLTEVQLIIKYSQQLKRVVAVRLE